MPFSPFDVKVAVPLAAWASSAPSPQSSPAGRGGNGQHFVLVFGFLNPYDHGFDPPEGS
jgi:hypothetical protein